MRLLADGADVKGCMEEGESDVLCRTENHEGNGSERSEDLDRPEGDEDAFKPWRMRRLGLGFRHRRCNPCSGLESGTAVCCCVEWTAGCSEGRLSGCLLTQIKGEPRMK